MNMKKFLSLTTVLWVVIALSVMAVMVAAGVNDIAPRVNDIAPAVNDMAPVGNDIAPEQATKTGILKLYLCDAPTDAKNITGVYITINETQYHRDGQWITCEDFVGPQKYDLLELTGGNSTLLGELTLPSGNYTQIRFMLDIQEIGPPPSNPGCYIEFADNSTEPLFVPSGGQTGYKAIGRFEVPVNGTVVVTADFDVRKAVVMAHSRYILKPTIKLIVND
jgi:hypothetical protein